MTARGLYEAILIELNKENAPNILLEDFNYFANKAINQYVNKRYNIYDINQQTTDDLRVLKATALLDPKKINMYDSLNLANGADYYIILPSDYLHMLNCICIYEVKQQYKCYNKGDKWRAAATRLTADTFSQVLDNYWNKPTYKRPYYYIHHVNTVAANDGDSIKFTRTTIPTNTGNSVESGDKVGVTDVNVSVLDPTPKDGSKDDVNSGNSIGTDESLSKTIKITNNIDISNIERAAGTRYGNVSEVRCEIRYGTDDSVFELKQVYIDYLKTPQHIRLTQQQVDRTNDTSQMLEYPDYVCQEIVNELVHIIMENISDQRLQTHPVVSQSIANPAQQQTEPVAQQQPT